MYGVIGIRLITASGANWTSRPRPWVAKITGEDSQFGLARDFLRPVYDYTYATRKGKNTFVYYHMAPGIYELYYPVSWKHDARYFARVDEYGDIHEITREEVDECLKNTILE